MAHTFYGSMQFFFKSVEAIFAEAKAKGYSDNDKGDGRDLLDFVKSRFGDHAAGEAVYKLVRWQEMKNEKDLFKAVAWCFLIWDQHRRQEGLGYFPDLTAAVDPYNPSFTSPAAEGRAMAAAADMAGEESRLVADILTQVAEEARRAETIHKPFKDLLLQDAMRVFLTESVEAMKEANDLQRAEGIYIPTVRLRLRAELIQVAAVCLNWIKHIDRSTVRAR